MQCHCQWDVMVNSVKWCPFLLKVSLVMVCSGSSVNCLPVLFIVALAMGGNVSKCHCQWDVNG